MQKRISDIVPSSLYVHCTAHNLNLVISDVAKSSLKISTFFDIVQNIFLFFSQSAPKWASLAFGDDIANQIQKKVLKKVCNIRWEARHSSVYALKENGEYNFRMKINEKLVTGNWILRKKNFMFQYFYY